MPRDGIARCPCGYRNDTRKRCNCSGPQIERYMGKISGPLLDRIDIQIEVPAVAFKELSATTPGMSSAEMRKAVVDARRVQADRLKSEKTGAGTMRYNGQLTNRQIRTFCKLGHDAQILLKGCMTELGFSARAHDKILRVARTIADLAGSRDIEVEHVGEAINYRLLDRELWK